MPIGRDFYQKVTYYYVCTKCGDTSKKWKPMMHKED